MGSRKQGDIRMYLSHVNTNCESTTATATTATATPATAATTHTLPQITVYTDGACPNQQNRKRKQKIGGWGVFIPNQPSIKRTEIHGYSLNTTSNQMEMTAIAEALNALPYKSYVTVYSDSQYFVNGITKWIKGWKRNNWKLANGQPVKNKELWMTIDLLSGRFYSVRYLWIKGHAGHEGNEMADKLANKGVEDGLSYLKLRSSRTDKSNVKS